LTDAGSDVVFTFAGDLPPVGSFVNLHGLSAGWIPRPVGITILEPS
jgi:hypothetical protein